MENRTIKNAFSLDAMRNGQRRRVWGGGHIPTKQRGNLYAFQSSEMRYIIEIYSTD